MGVVRREGKWTLEKVSEGLYEVRERDQLRAEIITDEFEPSGAFGGTSLDPMTETIEVGSFSQAETEFEQIASDSGGGGFGFF